MYKKCLNNFIIIINIYICHECIFFKNFYGIYDLDGLVGKASSAEPPRLDKLEKKVALGATVPQPLPRRWTCRGARLSRRSRLS